MDEETELRRLMAALAGNDVQALGPLYKHLASSIYRLALWRTGSSADAQDVVQDVFLRLASRRKKLAGIRHPKAYVLSAAHRCAVDILRRRRRERPLERLVEPEVPPSNGTPDAGACTAALLALPDLHREVVYLRYYEDMTFAQIGLTLGVSTFTAASRYRLAMKRLRRLLGVKT